MCFEKTSPFVRMILGAIVGIVIGIVLGLLFGLIIIWISETVSAVFPGGGSGPDYPVGSFAGMGFGAIIGAILGGLSANKK